VTKEQEQRAAMETTLSTIQASITSTEVRKDEQKEYILSLQKHKSLLDKKTKSATKYQQLMEETMEKSQTLLDKIETMEKSQTLLDKIETRHSALEDDTLKMEKGPTTFSNLTLLLTVLSYPPGRPPSVVLNHANTDDIKITSNSLQY
jgi:hypothetical protein